MKEIIKNAEKKIFVDDITNDSFVGVEFKVGSKIFVIQKENKFFGIELTDSDTEIINQWSADSMKDYINGIDDVGGGTSYIFPTFEKLIKWMLL